MDLSTSLASRAYDAIKQDAKPDGGGPLSAAGMEFAKVLQTGETTAKASMMGGVDPHTLVEALAKAEMAVETTIAVRNKVVEAYQEILRMPV